MFAAPTAALRAGDVVVVARRWLVVIADGRSGTLGTVLVRRGQLDRLRSHVLPGPQDLLLAGLPLSDVVICCDRVRPAPPARSQRVGVASARLLAEIARTLWRVAEADAAERGGSLRSTIWRCPGGDRGRQVGAKSVS